MFTRTPGVQYDVGDGVRLENKVNRSAVGWRDLRVASAIGLAITIALCVWFDAVWKPETNDNYMWLARLQEPGIRGGERLAYSLYPLIGYPWCARCGIACAYSILVGIWTVVSLVGIGMIRTAISYLESRAAQHE